ncbi:hypermethylated in cancer 2 protein-like isoform X2 [Crassostrea angulata]|uniref:hypermethylated in cancer 2 protein-like isoform X2 n=1 Tax=Magallana angulata TaxID=2784310 RepID=UPI0022B0D774|nr:hypermethylated in cancer 2 protein-like isoform X2 [Crassostrea angulata]XP_052696073.1 hypermethylated in cancer 2 protein-like isoform X2 [Crassostrea angulata]
MNCYQKFYTNQIHSSSLLCQLATMWKSQVLCDAIIRSGSVITKAHRVVLVAACPMLQSMENAAVGSHLEVRLAADIKQESIQTFLQYLYEGFMMLTEQNSRDVEKIARLLQVDSVIKCCADFNKCLGTKTGQMSANDQYKYTFHDMIEFKHVRSSEMQKTVQERTVKRNADYPRPPSPGSKRQRTQDMHADDTTSMASSYGHMAPDPWDRVPKLGMPFHTRVGQSSQQAGVIDMLEDSLELIETDPPDSSGGRAGKDQRSSQKGVSIAVASQVNSSTDLQVVDVATEQARSEARSRTSLPSQTRTAPANQTNSVSENGKSTNSHPAAKPSTHPSTPVMNEKLQVNSPPVMSPSSSQFNNRSSPQVRPESSAQKPFAAGSESQSSKPPPQQGSEIASNTNTVETVSETSAREMSEEGQQIQQKPTKPPTPDKPSTNLSIVKIESDEDEDPGAMEMYINMSGGGGESIRVQRADHTDQEEGDPQADWMRDEMSNEDSNVSGDQSNSWVYPQGSQAQYKGDAQELWTTPRDKTIVSNDSLHGGASEISQVEKTSFQFPIARNERFYSGRRFDVFKAKRTVLFSCKICFKGFSSKLGYENHMKQRHGTRDQCFSCNVCEKMFPTSNMLTIHQRVHSDYRPFECTQCGKGYKHKKDLKTHRCGQSRAFKL